MCTFLNYIYPATIRIDTQHTKPSDYVASQTWNYFCLYKFRNLPVWKFTKKSFKTSFGAAYVTQNIVLMREMYMRLDECDRSVNYVCHIEDRCCFNNMLSVFKFCTQHVRSFMHLRSTSLFTSCSVVITMKSLTTTSNKNWSQLGMAKCIIAV